MPALFINADGKSQQSNQASTGPARRGPEPEVAGDGDDGQDGGDATSKKLSEQLQATNKQLIESQIYAKLMGDPEIGAVLRGRQTGKKMKIVELDETGADPTLKPEPVGGQKIFDEDDDSDSTNDGQTKPAELNKTFNKMTNAVLTAVTKKLDPVIKKLEAIDGYLLEQEKAKGVQSVENLRKQYGDYDTYREPMLGLLQRHPTLDAEDLYILAKAKDNGFVDRAGAMAQMTSSEMPTTVAARAQTRRGSHTIEGIRQGISNSVSNFLRSNSVGLGPQG